jgi:acetolactate synthase-1/3 small subunit
MMEKIKQTFVISVFSENRIALLNKLTALFSRRRLNIESITVSETERKGMSRHTILLITERAVVENLVKQIRKIIEVYVVYGYEADDLIASETTLFKISTENLDFGSELHMLIHKAGSRVLLLGDNYVIVERQGTDKEIIDSFKEFEPYGILEFARSGRVALSKGKESLGMYLPELEEA